MRARAAGSWSTGPRGALLATVLVALGTQGATAAEAVPPALARAIAAPDRSPAFEARDAARHPAEELAFIGVTPRASVVEIWPGSGYWTQILAPLLHDEGSYTIAVGAADGDRLERAYAPSAKFSAMLAADPSVYDKVKVTVLSRGHDRIAAPGSQDFVLTFRNLHNWVAAGDAPEMLAAMRAALKPGGILAIEDHRANTRAPQDPKARSGYLRQDYAIALVEHAGFTLAGSSELEANPKDDADHPAGVWTLPPTLALGQTDRAKYLAIGEADNFLLKFRRTDAP